MKRTIMCLTMGLVVILMWTIAPGAALAAVTVTAGSPWPDTGVLTSHYVGSHSFVSTARWIGDMGIDRVEACQSFYTDTGQKWIVDKVSVSVRDVGSSVVGQPFKFQIWSVTDAKDFSGNELIASQSGTFPDSDLYPSLWTFDIDDVALNHDRHYAFLIGFETGPDPQRYINIVMRYASTTQDQYPTGRLFCRIGSELNWSSSVTGSSSHRDFEFSIQGDRFALGDLDGNGVLNGLDIPAFKHALAFGHVQFFDETGIDPLFWADFNCDGYFNGLDIPGFKAAMASAAAVPEPATIGLALCAAVAILKRHHR